MTVGLDEDLVGCLGPGEGAGAVVSACDESADLDVEVLDGAEGAAADGLAFGRRDPACDDSARERDPTLGETAAWFMQVSAIGMPPGGPAGRALLTG